MFKSKIIILCERDERSVKDLYGKGKREKERESQKIRENE